MYLSADDARSDFFLAAAVYVIGPTLLQLLIRALPALFGNIVVGTVVSVAFPFLTIAAMPIFLLRYREESLAPLRTGDGVALGLGLGLGAVFAGSMLLASLPNGADVAFTAQLLGLSASLSIIVRWASTAVLAVFLYTRAEYAFRPFSEAQQSLVRRAGIVCVATVGVTSLLLLLAGRPLVSVLPAAGLAGMFLLAERQMPQQGLGERWWVWAPVITLALGPLEILGFLSGGAGFLISAQQAAVVATFGLVAVMALHGRRGAALVFGMAMAFVVADVLSLVGGSQFAV